MRDLSLLDTVTPSEEGRYVTPVGFDGEPVGLRIKVYGPDSKAYAKAKDRQQSSFLKRFADAQAGTVDPKDKDDDSVAKEVEALVELTADWEPVDADDPIVWEGKPFPFSRSNAKKLYERVPTVRAQVRAYIENRRNFTLPGPQASAAPSGPGSNSTGRKKTARPSEST